MSSEAAFVSTAATSLVTTTETAVLTFTIPPENNPAGQGIFINASFNFTPGGSTTAVTLRVRQGSGTAGAVVGVPFTTPVVAAVANSNAEATVVDPTLVYPAGNTYTLTAQQVGAAANGTAAQALANVSPITALVG
jgi:hypothetical protein